MKSKPDKTMTNKKVVTLYMSGAFGVQKLEGSLVEFGTKPYAQYPKAPYVVLIPKGKRKPIGILKGYAPYMVLLEGVGHPDVFDPFGPKKDSGNAITQTSRFSSFDERYKTEFDTVLNKVVSENPAAVLMDVRHTVRTNVVNGPHQEEKKEQFYLNEI